MKAKGALRAAIAVGLCAAGFALARGSRYRKSTVLFDANGCRLLTDVIDRGSDYVAGSVVLIHGVAANKKIMAYLADAFAEQGLRVFVPDLPGHGRTPGPFSFARAESCTESLVQELAARRMTDPKRTLLAGHSMGGAIAVRVAAHTEVAGVIAVSPAPMRAGPGVPVDVLPYQNPPPLHDNTLVISAAFEPFGIRAAARELVAVNPGASQFLLIPGGTHVSVLFDPRVARAVEDWAARVLALQPTASVPSSRPLIGSLLGFVGILLLAGPFVREALGPKGEFGRTSAAVVASGASSGAAAQPGMAVLLSAQQVRFARALLEIVMASFVAVVVLRFWNPFSFLRFYNGGYFGSFLLLTGIAILVVHFKTARSVLRAKVRGWTALRMLAAAAFAALALHLLVTGWFDATLTEAWMPGSRWTRFPVLLVAALAYLFGEEVLLQGRVARGKFAAVLRPIALRLVLWLPLAAAIFVLHSGAILLILLAPYIFLFFVLQSAGAGVVRTQTGSPLAAALFGAILLAAFCLVIFPVT